MNDNSLEGAMALLNVLQMFVAIGFVACSAAVAVYAYLQPPGWAKWIAWSLCGSLILLLSAMTWLELALLAIGMSEHAIGVTQAGAYAFLVLSILGGMLFRVVTANSRRFEQGASGVRCDMESPCDTQ